MRRRVMMQMLRERRHTVIVRQSGRVDCRALVRGRSYAVLVTVAATRVMYILLSYAALKHANFTEILSQLNELFHQK